jgi:dihydrolipoamide dehydrogenase
MKKAKAEVIYGTGKLQKGNVLAVTTADGKTTSYAFNDIIIATGARPRTLPHIPIDGEVIHTYRTILEYKKLPKKTLIIGGGVIGVEFGYFHSAFGAEVTIVERCSIRFFHWKILRSRRGSNESSKSEAFR